MSSLLEAAKNAMDAVRGYIDNGIPPLAELFDLDAAIREVEARQSKCDHWVAACGNGMLAAREYEERIAQGICDGVERETRETCEVFAHCPKCGKELAK